MTKSKVFGGFVVRGKRRYPGAASRPGLEDFTHLAHEHDHPFCFRWSVEVLHDERDVEFLSFSLKLRETLGPEPVSFGDHSCEAIARKLHDYIAAQLPGRSVSVRVEEDALHGAEVSS